MAFSASDQGKNQGHHEGDRGQNLGQTRARNGVLAGSVKSVKKSDIHLPTRENIKRDSIERGKEQELRAMRDRLYSRAEPLRSHERQTFSPVRTLPDVPQKSIDARTNFPAAAIIEETEMSQLQSPAKKITLKGYRAKIIAVAVLFFVVALALSSSFLFFGQNTISGNNIEIDVEAPFAIGGGEELALDVAVTNKNAVAVDSATLIIEYPSGTQSVDTQGKELFRDRIPLGSIKPGEVLTRSIAARIFGEENEEKVVNLSVEYRVAGSNATFFKEADPLKIKITSSPVVLSIDAIKEVSSGQDLTLTLSLASNSSVPLTDLLIEAEYPFGFDFSGSTPKPVKGQNIWRIKTLAPGAKEKIAITGAMAGGSAAEGTFNFSVGVPSERDRFSLASVLTKGSTAIKLTDPFVGLTVTTNGSTDKTVSVGQSDSVTVSITFKNTLSDTIYDGSIKTTLSGNGLNAQNVSAGSGGFYNSSTNTITWDKGGVSGLAELAPGAQEIATFTLGGVNLDAARTPEVSYKVSVSGRRVSESRVPQELTNIISRTVRFESATSISSHGLYSIGPFTNTGPVPPKAETATTYTVMLDAKNGSNELADGVVTTTLPSYVTWTSAVSSGADISYNSGTREVAWRIGTLAANASVHAAFQISFFPSVSQVGTVPTLVNAQNFRATDRFTGTVVRATSEALTTALPEDPSSAARDGRVEAK